MTLILGIGDGAGSDLRHRRLLAVQYSAAKLNNAKNSQISRVVFGSMERVIGIEPTTFSLGS